MNALSITLPDWMDDVAERFRGKLDGDEARMELCVALSRRNVEHAGGPFGAALFAGNELIGLGVNCVLASGFSIAHAEILALMSAEQRIMRGAAVVREPYCLVASTEPCCQCFGALVWAGVTRLVCGATTTDNEALGFDEGPKPSDWPALLEQRGISVTLGVRRAQAKAVLDEYRRRGGKIYGSRRRSAP